jgi:DNA replicative helicase MCM subunit Mcm2 (Cdc46/Mcm family)
VLSYDNNCTTHNDYRTSQKNSILTPKQQVMPTNNEETLANEPSASNAGQTHSPGSPEDAKHVPNTMDTSDTKSTADTVSPGDSISVVGSSTASSVRSSELNAASANYHDDISFVYIHENKTQTPQIWNDNEEMKNEIGSK